MLTSASIRTKQFVLLKNGCFFLICISFDPSAFYVFLDWFKMKCILIENTILSEPVSLIYFLEIAFLYIKYKTHTPLFCYC